MINLLITKQYLCDLIGLRVRCEYYHAGLQPKERRRVHDLFIRDEIQVDRFKQLLPLTVILIIRMFSHHSVQLLSVTCSREHE